MNPQDFLWLPLVSLLTGCAAEQVRLDALFHEVQQNEVGALDKYEGKSLRVQGTVQKVGLKTIKELHAELTPWSVSVKATEEDKQIPYAVLTASPPKPGNLVCYFDYKHEAASLREGTPATLEGTLKRVEKHDNVAMVYLESCWVPQ